MYNICLYRLYTIFLYNVPSTSQPIKKASGGLDLRDFYAGEARQTFKTVYIYIYMYIEREREIDVGVYIYIYIYICYVCVYVCIHITWLNLG